MLTLDITFEPSKKIHGNKTLEETPKEQKDTEFCYAFIVQRKKRGNKTNI